MEAYQITDPSAVAQARRAVAAFAAGIQFDDEDAGRAALVATELASNLVKHGDGGELLVGRVERGDRFALDIIALDQGAGMTDVAKCLRDGYSTGGSPGTGLGAVQRLSQTFDIYSQPDKGTAVAARLWPKAPVPRGLPSALDVGSIVKPKPGETACGDNWCHVERIDGFVLLGVDGLGHGLLAADVAVRACETFGTVSHLAPGHIMEEIHAALRPTRGAAVTVVDAALDRGHVTIASMGNLVAAIVTHGTVKRLASDNGIAGHTACKARELAYPCAPSSAVILHSDGLSASWQLDRYPGLMQHQSSLIAGVLYRDHNRGRDDSMIVVVKRGEP